MYDEYIYYHDYCCYYFPFESKCTRTQRGVPSPAASGFHTSNPAPYFVCSLPPLF